MTCSLPGCACCFCFSVAMALTHTSGDNLLFSGRVFLVLFGICENKNVTFDDKTLDEVNTRHNTFMAIYTTCYMEVAIYLNIGFDMWQVEEHDVVGGGYTCW